MRRTPIVKPIVSRMPLRKTATSASAVARRNFPAWIESDDGVVTFSAGKAATPRVRDGLVLRTVSKKKSAGRSGSHGSGNR
jgi:hypothetical protein